MKTEFSSDWGRMQESLTSLHMQNNYLKDIPFGEVYSLSKLHKLRFLDLGGNKLKNLVPGSLPQSIEILDLSTNLLTSFPGIALDKLNEITFLNLKNNNIEKLILYFRTKND